MATLEQKIRDFTRSLDVPVIGVAGPDRLDGPPSLDPTYTMRGAKSIVSYAIPMDVPAIYDFLSKKSHVTHNLDQLVKNQRIHHLGGKIEAYIKSLGFKARAVPSNNSYRRSLDPFSTHPSFSHRFGALASGIAGQGMSGNVMTKEYGAAVYLGTVVTDAVLTSDPQLPPRYFIDGYCQKCQVCHAACPTHMFLGDEEEYVLLNGALHPRGKRRTIEFCNASCFGLHSLSLDKKWSSWGAHWVDEWVERDPDPEKDNIRLKLLKKGASVGDSTERYRLIRNLGYFPYPENLFTRDKLAKKEEDFPADELERRKVQSADMKKYCNIKIENSNVLTCGQCALVCGPDIHESTKRLKMLREGGIVVSGKDKRTVVVKTFDEAVAVRRQYPWKVSVWRQLYDIMASTVLWTRLYWGIEPKSIIQNMRYKRKLKRALARRESVAEIGEPLTVGK